MTWGLKVLDAAGHAVLDTSDIGGVFVEVLTCASGATGSKTYNTDARFAGRTARCVQATSGTHDWIAGSSGGYPYVSWTARAVLRLPSATILLVFVS
jgi:hypothetical protein